MDQKKLKRWMIKQRAKLWLAERVIEISKEVERIARPDIRDIFPVRMKTAAIRVLTILPDEIEIEHMDTQKSHWLKRGDVFKLNWLIEGIE